MLSPNLTWDITRIQLNREEICQNCEIWICVKNCRECIFNILCAYEKPNSQNWIDF